MNGQLMPVYLSTTHDDPKLQQQMLWFLKQPGIKWLTASKSPDPSIPQLHITRSGVFLQCEGHDPLFFHPSMALLRLINILKGEDDRFLQALQVTEGDLVLDATMGLATDALVAAWAVGDRGKVVALEYSPIICALVSHGLKELAQGAIPKVSNPVKRTAWQCLAAAARRIEVIYADHNVFLFSQEPKSYDIIYFDPMFRRAKKRSTAIRPLRRYSDHHPLKETTIAQAAKIARKRVVLKERKSSPEFERLGFTVLPGGKNSPIDYGVITC